MKIKKNQMKIKSGNKSNYPTKIHPNIQIKNEDFNEEDNQDIQNDPEYEEEEQNNY